jgi:hypothetical protein
MNIVKQIDQYDKNCVFLCEPIKNNIMVEGNFIRIIYSTNNVVLNGIYLLITLNDVACEKYYTKYRCNFNVSLHKHIIDNIKTIEEDLLKKYEIINKIPQHKIYEQLQNGNLKTFTDIGSKQSCSFVLKISGIWETQYNYGLTYKFMNITSVNN